MRFAIPMFLMLVSGLALGIGGATMLWSARSNRAQSGWQQIAKRFEAIAIVNQDGWKECLAITKKQNQPRSPKATGRGDTGS